MSTVAIKAAPPRALLRVRHTRDRHGNPLAEIVNLPDPGAEFSPCALRALAQALIAAAADTEDLHAHGLLGRNLTFEYPL